MWGAGGNRLAAFWALLLALSSLTPDPTAARRTPKHHCPPPPMRAVQTTTAGHSASNAASASWAARRRLVEGTTAACAPGKVFDEGKSKCVCDRSQGLEYSRELKMCVASTAADTPAAPAAAPLAQLPRRPRDRTDPAPPPLASTSDAGGGLPTAAIVGIAVGSGALALVTVSLLSVVLVQRRRARRDRGGKKAPPSPEPACPSPATPATPANQLSGSSASTLAVSLPWSSSPSPALSDASDSAASARPAAKYQQPRRPDFGSSGRLSSLPRSRSLPASVARTIEAVEDLRAQRRVRSRMTSPATSVYSDHGSEIQCGEEAQSAEGSSVASSAYDVLLARQRQGLSPILLAAQRADPRPLASYKLTESSGVQASPGEIAAVGGDAAVRLEPARSPALSTTGDVEPAPSSLAR